jgi:hypothetical protein
VKTESGGGSLAANAGHSPRFVKGVTANTRFGAFWGPGPRLGPRPAPARVPASAPAMARPVVMRALLFPASRSLSGRRLVRRPAITLAMSERHTVAMLTVHYRSPRDLQARAELAAALPDAEITEPDDIGVFQIMLDAEDQEHALTRVWDGMAASGTDDHIMFLEHPELPEHWRHRSGRPES